MSRVRALSLTELRLFLREPVTVLFTLALPLMVLYVLNGVFGQQPAGADPGEPVVYRGFDAPDWYTPAYLVMAVAGFALIALPAHLVEYHESGVLRRFQASGLPKGTVLLSQATVAMVVATVGCGLLVAAALAFTGASPPESLGLLVAAYLVRHCRHRGGPAARGPAAHRPGGPVRGAPRLVRLALRLGRRPTPRSPAPGPAHGR